MKIRSAIFDLDGTLVDSLMFWEVFWSELGKKYLSNPDFRPTPEIDKKARTLIFKDATKIIYDEYGFGKSAEELTLQGYDLIREFYTNRVSLKKGVKEFLELCDAHGVKMFVASATEPELIKVALERFEISKYFQGVVSCSDIGKGKEEPDVFLKTAELLGEVPQNIWVFEDSLTAVETATKAGFNTVGIWDERNFGQDRMRELSTVYIAQGETLLKLESMVV